MSSAMETQCREGAVEDQRGIREKAGCSPQVEGRGKMRTVRREGGAGKGTEVFHEYSETDRAAEDNQGRGC